MKIGLWHNLNSGGAKRALFYHIEGLVKRGHTIISFCPDTVDQTFLPLSLIIKENIFPLKERLEKLYKSRFRKIYSYRLMLERFNLMLDHCRQCGAIINQSHFDVLLSNSSSDFYMSHIGRFVSGPKVIYLNEPFRPLYEAFPELPWKAPEKNRRRFTSLGNIRNEVTYWRKLFALSILAREELSAARSYDLILANSLFSRESIMRAYRLEAKVCYLGIDTGKFRCRDLRKERMVVGVGSFGHLKGIDRAILSISKIPKEKRPELVWIGNLPDMELIESLKALARSLDVKFDPKYNVAEEELILYLQRAAVMIFLPILEPFGLVPLEANACGTAVIGIAEGGLRETIMDNYNGYIINDFNPEEIASRVQLFTDDLSFAEAMGASACKYVQEKWNYDRGIRNIETYLADLVKKKRSKEET